MFHLRPVAKTFVMLWLPCVFTGFVSLGVADPTLSDFQAGFAEADITPAIGMEMPGGYEKSFHQTFHDACKVRVSLFDDGKQKVVLVGVDTLMVPRSLVMEVKKEIQEKCGIPPEAILIGASHSHSSGPLGMVQPGEYDWAPPLIQKLAYEKSSGADAGYVQQVRAALVDAVCKADRHRIPVQCGVGKGIEDQVAFNRRFHMKNGLVYTHPGKGNPELISPAGPTDPEVGVIGAWDGEGKLVGCVVNYACHATTNPGGISANWIYYMEQVIRGCFGNQVVVVFLQGFCGDVTQVDNQSRYAERAAEDSARFVGGRIGAEVVKTLIGMPQGLLNPTKSASRVLTFSRRVPDVERVKQCLDRVQKDPDEVGHTEWTFAKETVLLDAILSKFPTVDAEIQAIQVGPAVFLSAPGEMFCQFGLDLKKQSPFAFTFPVELANGCVGYVPTPEALSEQGGGYETRLTSYSNLLPSAGTQMMETALQLASTMTPGVQPEREKAPEFGGAWTYGNVPPELK